MTDVLLYGLPTLAVIVLALAIRFWPDRGPRCDCGQPGAFLRSDGTYECDDCTERRLSGRAPRPR